LRSQGRVTLEGISIELMHSTFAKPVEARLQKMALPDPLPELDHISEKFVVDYGGVQVELRLETIAFQGAVAGRMKFIIGEDVMPPRRVYIEDIWGKNVFAKPLNSGPHRGGSKVPVSLLSPCCLAFRRCSPRGHFNH
jgi:hypothetical protein